MEQDMRTRTHPRKNLGQRNMRLRKERPSSRKISLYLYKMTFPNVRWREIWADTWQAPAEKNKYLRPHSSDCKNQLHTGHPPAGSTQNIEKVTQQQFFFLFEVRLLRTDLYRWFHCFTRCRACRGYLRLLLCLELQIFLKNFLPTRGQPWAQPWTPVSDVTPGVEIVITVTSSNC